ncbi:MAG: extracellular solute-binding protein [Clostridia bacterium]|nr:extracellular solute-binding protein [Clostridia bacterium]
MKKNFKKVVLTAAALGSALALAACNGGGEQTATSDSTNIRYWVPLSGNASQIVTNMGETPLAQKLMEKFGCTIEYMHPAQGQDGEKFNLLVASGDLPDIIEYKWMTGYQGGPQKAIADGVIYPLDLQKDAPNLYAYAKEHPDIDKMMKTDDGQYFGYPFIRGDEYLLTSAGLIIREDWLQELGLEMPETLDDWTNVLREFKAKKSTGAPIGSSLTGAINQGSFVTAFGIQDGFYLEDGKVVYGPMDDRYKDFLAFMNEWYKEGLIDQDYASPNAASAQSNMLNGVNGVAFASCGSGIGKWMAAATEEGFSVTGAKNPVMNKGEVPMFGNYQNPVTGTVAVISMDADNKDLCAKLLDYGYSEEGKMLFNFGIEGESYNMVDGYPKYTEEITNNPEGLSMAVSMSRYTMSHAESCFIQDKRYMEQYAQLPQQKMALDNWMATDVAEHFLPPITLTMEQQSELISSIDNINTYKAEMQVKFITGVEPLENFDQFREGLKERQIEKYLQYQQEAYERYLSR